MALDLGVNSGGVGYLSLPSPFPVATREVWYRPIADVTYENKDVAYPQLVKYLNEDINSLPQDNVMIHTVNYQLTSYLRDNLYLPGRTIMTHNQQDRAEVLAAFMKSPTPAVLLSPSMERGVSLDGEACRYQYVAKISYPNLKSPQVNRRLYGCKDGNLWYQRTALRNLLQSTGRATRYMGDFSRTTILDRQFQKLYDGTKSLIPKWWGDALIWK
jgi:Rad3-related DNA helicase